MKSKRFEVLSQRPVNQDGYVKEWVEEGFIAMESPHFVIMKHPVQKNVRIS